VVNCTDFQTVGGTYPMTGQS